MLIFGTVMTLTGQLKKKDVKNDVFGMISWKWSDLRCVSLFVWRYLDPKNIPSKHRSPQEV